MQVTFSFAGEITQVLDAILWVRCASGNVFTYTYSIDLFPQIVQRFIQHFKRIFHASILKGKLNKKNLFMKEYINFQINEIFSARGCVSDIRPRECIDKYCP